MSRRSKTKLKPPPAPKKRSWIVIVLLVVGLGAYGLSKWQDTSRAPLKPAATTTPQPTPAAQLPAVRPSPPFHKNPEDAKPFPRLVPASYYSSQPLVARAYRIAAQMPEVLSQQPCYCYCDRLGHGSLLECYASDHAAG